MNKFKNIFIVITIIALLIVPNKVFAFTLTYDANGGSGTMNSEEKTGSVCLTNTNNFTAPTGKVFVGWSFTENALKADIIRNCFDMDEDKTVYAVWFTPVTEATATVIEPVGGVLPDIHPVSGNSTIYSTGGQSSLTDAQWSTNFNSYIEFNKNNAFVTGTDYTLFMAFRSEEGYCFTDDTVFKINGNVATEFSTTGSSDFIRGEKYTFTATSTTSTSNVNVTINDYSTTNRGKFSIANNINSDKPESTSTLSVNLVKNSVATLYITPELEYIIEKITVNGNEISFVKDTSASGVNKPYKATFTVDGNKNVIIYFKAKKLLNYNLSVAKTSTDIFKIEKNINKEQFINQKKTDFINTINAFKEGKENVTDLTETVIASLFTENKYAVITNITYKDSSYVASDDLIAIGDLDDWNSIQIAQGSLERTANYEIEYIEVTLSEINTENPKTSDNILKSVIFGSLSIIGIASCGLYINKKKKFNS